VTRAAAARRGTRAALVEAAARLFAARGFRRVTVRAICREAGANVAAVNYHFGDKLGLYREVLELALAAMREITDAAVRAGDGRPAADRLRAYIAVATAQILAPRRHQWIHELLTREMADPTPALSAIVDRGLRPRIMYLAQIVAELMARPSDDVRVLACATSVQAQILMLRPNPVGDRLRTAFKVPRADAQRAAEHITRFSLGGIAATATAGRQEEL
jgi:TetR/AcrR family transcriptional regulator, regulator of cefoperazone and chloramphenicol sensitivity